MTPDLYRKLELIAHQLGGSWQVSAHEHNARWVILSDNELEIWVDLDRDRFRFSPRYPQQTVSVGTSSTTVYGSNAPIVNEYEVGGISCSAKRTVNAIAADLQRRLINDFRLIYPDCLAYIQKWADNARADHEAKSIVTRKLRRATHNKTTYAYINYATRNSVSIELRSLTPAQACMVAELLEQF